MRFLTLLFLGATLLATQLPALSQKPRQPVPVILDTDIGPDYDDVGAMALLHALADRGEVRPLAVISCNQHPLVVPTIEILNTYFGRPDLPTGAPKGKAVNMGASQKWPELLVEKYPHRIRSTADAPDAVTTYRRILAAQPDRSVTIVTIGFLTNLADLLASGPDQYSKLPGRALVAQKVNEWVCMGGEFPKGREFNIFMDSTAAERAIRDWPTPALFSGFEIGRKVLTGRNVVDDPAVSGPVKDVFARCLPLAKEDNNGRMSWDQTALLVAIRGPEPYYTTRPGRFTTSPSGRNGWDAAGRGHRHLVEKMPPADVAAVIEAFMKHQPKK